MTNKDRILYNFLEQAKSDDRLLPSHLSVFTALHHLLTQSEAENCVVITRKKIMQIAKIGSISTYHRCMSELTLFEYIIYKPSYDHYAGSLVIFDCKSEASKLP